MSVEYEKRRRPTRISRILALALMIPATGFDQTTDILGVMVGRVYEVDQAKYEEYRRRIDEQLAEDGEANVELLDPDEYLNPLPDAVVTARRISTNVNFSSSASDSSGDYLIRETPVGAYGFTIVHRDQEHEISQILDLNVELSYIAELCFVVDPEGGGAWMISEGVRRGPEVPRFVPERCQSSLSGCLALLTGDSDGFPNGLLLLLAGSGAAASTLGIISVDQDEASPPVQR